MFMLFTLCCLLLAYEFMCKDTPFLKKHSEFSKILPLFSWKHSTVFFLEKYPFSSVFMNYRVYPDSQGVPPPGRCAMWYVKAQ